MKEDDAGIRLANAFISIRRGRVTCSPLRSISSTSFARSPPLPSVLPVAPFLSSLSPIPLRIPFRLLFHSFFSLARYLRFHSSAFRPVSVFLVLRLHSLFLSVSLSLSLFSFFLCENSRCAILFSLSCADLFLFPRLRAEREYFLAFARQALLVSDVFRLNEER